MASTVDEMPRSSQATSAEDEKAPTQQYVAHDSFEEEPVYGNLNLTLWNSFIYFVRYLFIVALVGAPLAVPIVIYRNDWDAIDKEKDEATARQEANLRFYVFCWLETFWLCACFSHFLIKVFPYIFFCVTRYLNSAHRRYWRIFRALKWPYTLLGGVIGGFISFRVFVLYNPAVVANVGKAEWNWQNTIDDIQEQCLYWIIAYFLERILILYISIHYHYRSDRGKIMHGKKMEAALCSLYDASTYLNRPYSKAMADEDLLIHSHHVSGRGGKRKEAAKLLQRIGVTADRAVTFTGRAIGSDKDSHFWKASSTYATIEYALEDTASAEALAKRIWKSLVAEGRDALTANDIAEVFGPHRREEAEQCFNILDENENGDIRLSEFVPTVVDLGRRRHATYRSMQDIDHAIMTFDWVVLLIIAVLMIYFILVAYVPTIKDIKTEIQFASLGLAFAFGRTIHEFLAGAIFVFFKHPFDIGDCVDLYNRTEATCVSATATRISLLYVVFERVDTGQTCQFPTSALANKRIENRTRSGRTRETVALHIDFGTPFADVLRLRAELEAFLRRRDNARDFRPELGLRVAGVGGDMGRLELTCRVEHKGNGVDEDLRAARSSRFMCALVRACKRIPINKPGGSGAKTGDEGKPSYSVLVSEDEAAKKRDAEKLRVRKLRLDHIEEEGGDAADAVDEAAAEAAAEEKRKRGETEEKRREEEEALAQLAEIPAAVQHRARLGSSAVEREFGTGRAAVDDGEQRGLRRNARGGGAGTMMGDRWEVGLAQ